MNKAAAPGFGIVRISIILTCTLAIAAALTGCTNLKAVHDFAALSTEGQTLQGIAAELANSPKRQIQFAATESAKNELVLAANIGKTNEQRLVAAHGILQNYMAALASLASDGIVASNNALAGFNQELAEAGMFGAHAQERDAFGKLAELVDKAATDFYRQAKLREMIDQAAPAFPVAIGALQRIVTNDCVMVLQSELGNVNQYYKERSGILDQGTSRWAVVLVEEIRRTRVAALEDKIQVCRQYGVILQRIADGHAAMARNLNHLDAKQLVATLEGYEQQICSVYDSFNKLK